MEAKKHASEHPFRRAMVIGCPGSGKSTFSRALHRITGLPLHHLDMLNWNQDGTTVPKDVFIQRLQDVLVQDAWIIDGNYLSTMALRLAACDRVFFLDYPVDICLQGIQDRKGQPRPDTPWVEPVDHEDAAFMSFIREFPDITRPKVLALLQGHADKQIITLHSREEAEDYLDALSAALPRSR